MHVCMYIYRLMCICVYLCVFVGMCMHVCVFVCVHVCVYGNSCTWTHLDTYILVETHIQGLVYTDIFPCSVNWEGLEARSTPGTQTLDSGAIMQEKESAILGDTPLELAQETEETERVWCWEVRTCWRKRKQNAPCGRVRGTQEPTARATGVTTGARK